MAKLKIELVIGLNNNSLTFDETQVLDWSTKTFCTSEASSTIFDVFPNSGQIVLKDIGLDLYNNSINGLFDSNYNYEVNIYIDDEKIAHHIINQQPYYNYEDKTLTLDLGNELDITNELVYEGYKYPLEEQDFLTIFKNIVLDIFSISETELNKLLSTKYDYDKTFGEYFSTIKIQYPYLSSKPQREILKNLLTIAKCCLYQDENEKPVLVRMDGGYSGSVNGSQINHDMYKNVNFVLPDQINKGFVPSIIQKNNYNVAEISCNRIDIVSNKGVSFKNYISPNETHTNTINYKSYDEFTEIPIEQRKNCSFFSGERSSWKGSIALLLGIEYKTTSFLIEVPKKTNMNLSEILSISDFTYLLFTGKIEEKTKTGNIKFVTVTEETFGADIDYYNINQTGISSSSEKNINNYNLKNNIFYFPFTPKFGTDQTEKTILYSFPKIEPVFEIKETTDDKFVIKCSNIVTGYKYLSINNPDVAYTNKDEGGEFVTSHIDSIEYKETTITTEKLQISFLGDTYDIEFSGETVSVSPNSSTIQNPNKMVVSNGGGLMQHVGDITETSFPVQYGLDLLGWAKGGIKTGELTVIKDVYNSDFENFEQISVQKTLIAGGTLTVEGENIKNIKKYGIYTVKLTKGAITKSSNIYNNSIIDINTGTTTIQIKVKIENGKIIFTNLNPLDTVYINSISKYYFSNIVGSLNHKIFKVGDLIVPCKDYNYTPILINSSDEPILYQVVEATTYGEGGAVFQDLKVRQVKIKKAEELPYYLVANDTGITICIRENGYATEGSNNQIIQIAWQT